MARGRRRQHLGGDEEIQESLQESQLHPDFGGQFIVGDAGVVLVGDGPEYLVVDKELDNANLDHGIEVLVYRRRHGFET